jgi:hypothetical protein
VKKSLNHYIYSRSFRNDRLSVSQRETASKGAGLIKQTMRFWCAQFVWSVLATVFGYLRQANQNLLFAARRRRALVLNGYPSRADAGSSKSCWLIQ